MKKENKDLLLKDLCVRLPYGVKMNHIADDEVSPKTLIGVAKDMITLESFAGYSCVNVEHYKPYLFPLSSMTEEQKEDIELLCDGYDIDDEGNSFASIIIFRNHNPVKIDMTVIDWFNKNHFDYRGLIEKGLANDATDLNIY